jgi:hypothetical protein
MSVDSLHFYTFTGIHVHLLLENKSIMLHNHNIVIIIIISIYVNVSLLYVLRRLCLTVVFPYMSLSTIVFYHLFNQYVQVHLHSQTLVCMNVFFYFINLPCLPFL